MMDQVLEKYRLAVDIGRSGGDATCAKDQYVSWSDGHFEARISAAKLTQIVPLERGNYSFIYLMRAGDVIKIGMSKNPKERMSALKTGAAAKLELYAQTRVSKADARSVEAGCHRVLREFRTAGEWFSIRPQIGQMVIDHVRRNSPDKSGITAILEYEKFRLSADWENADRRLRLEMAVRANPTVSLGDMLKVLPRAII